MNKLNYPVIILSICITLSLACNIYQFASSGNTTQQQDSPDSGASYTILQQRDANSRDTYYSIHHIREAQKLAKGVGVKVGIIDAYFDMEGDPGLYAGGHDFSGEPDSLARERSHGWQMAAVLKEIAPECEIYALNLSHENEERRVESIIEAIQWAEDNKIEVLTLSQGQVPDELRPQLDEAVNHAVENGIVTCFIHYDNPNNILPYSTTPYGGDYNRDPDINVYHYDYNTIWVEQLDKYLSGTNEPESGDDVPFFSYSSMSPVTAGFVAILKSINPGLTPADYKQLLIDTSYSMEYQGVMDWENGTSAHTVDIYQAALALTEGKF